MATEQEVREAIDLPGNILKAAKAGASSELLPATLAVEGSLKNRVFNLGLKADGTPIGSYSTRSGYFHLPSLRAKYGSTLPLAGLRAQGKPPKGKKKGAKARTVKGTVVPLQSIYLEGGYSEFRALVNRQNSRVDLMLSGAMAESIQTGVTDNEASIAFTREEEAEKADGHEVRFGGVAGNEDPVIFIATREDAEGVIEALTLAAEREVAKLFAQ